MIGKKKFKEFVYEYDDTRYKGKYGFIEIENPAYEYGTSSFQKVEDIKPYLKNKKAGCLYVALVDYGRYDLKYLSDYDGTSIDAIRVCFKKHEIDLVLDYAEEIRKKGYQVCIQHVDTMGFSDDEIIEFIINTLSKWFLYLDSNLK